MDTFFGNWKFARLGDLDVLEGLVSASFWNVLDGLDDFVALEDFAEDNVSTVEMAGTVSGVATTSAVKLTLEWRW